MSAISVETILSRAMSDKNYADQLFNDPERALAGFELTAEEAANLKGLTRTEFERVIESSPEDRKSFRIATNHNQSQLHVSE